MTAKLHCERILILRVNWQELTNAQAPVVHPHFASVLTSDFAEPRTPLARHSTNWVSEYLILTTPSSSVGTVLRNFALAVDRRHGSLL